MMKKSTKYLHAAVASCLLMMVDVSSLSPRHGKGLHRPSRNDANPLAASTVEPSSPESRTRRDALQTTRTAFIGAVCGWTVEPQARQWLIHNGVRIASSGTPTTTAMAALVLDPSEAPKVSSADSIRSFLQGTVTIPADFDFEMAQAKTQVVDPTGKTMTPVPALYITCRPNRPDNVPQAILDGSRGKPPPVLSARFEQPNFPFSFHLTSIDFTLEGKPSDDASEVWWLGDDLTVSARLDMDGIAVTRSPEDLVGRTVYQRKKGGEAVDLALTGRGAFGKFATQKK